VLDPVDQAYVDVPCARLEQPSITLFEHRQAVAQIKADGLAQVDEETIFRAVAEQREIAKAAAARTRSARRRLARVTQMLAEPLSMAPSGTPLHDAWSADIDHGGDGADVIAVPRLYPVTRW
jgi:putative transposase